MSGVVALLREGRVVTVCCGGHRPAPQCTCCPECTTNLRVAWYSPAVRAGAARAARAHLASLRLAARRAEHLVTVAALEEMLRSLRHATAAAVDVLPPEYPSQQGVLE